MKLALLALASSLLLSCASDTQGNDTFLGLTGSDWVGVGTDAGKAAVISYGERRAYTSAKNPTARVQP